MSKQSVKRVWAAVVFGAAVGAGCATTQVETDYDQQANFAQYRTFAVQPGKIVPDPGTVQAADPVPNTLVQGRIDQALKEELAAKGLQPVQQNPDLIVTYTAGVRTKQDVENVWGDAGWTYGDDFDGVWVDQYEEDKLVIDVIDADTKKLVYRAVAKAEDQNLNDEKFIQKAVDKALKNYPAASGA